MKLTNTSLDCLTKHSYNEERCKKEVEDLYRCCNAFYEERGPEAKTVSCPKVSLLVIKMRQLAQEKARS